MHPVLRAFALLAIAGCSAGGESRAPGKQPVPFLPYDITAGLRCEREWGLLGCLRRHEDASARSGTSGATRDGGRLCLPGRTVPTCFNDAAGLAYTLLQSNDDPFVVVETDATGGYTVILVDVADGSRRRVDNRPLHASGSDLFATVSYDVDAGYVPNRVAVWSDTLPDPVYEFSGFAPGTGPTGVRWVGPVTLEVRFSREPDSPDGNATDSFRVWQDAQGAWRNDYTR